MPTWRSVCNLGHDRPERNALVKLHRRFDVTLVAGPARLQHGEVRFRQDVASNVLGLAVSLDACGEPEVGLQTNLRDVFRSHCAAEGQADARSRPKADHGSAKPTPRPGLQVECSCGSLKLTVPKHVCLALSVFDTVVCDATPELRLSGALSWRSAVPALWGTGASRAGGHPVAHRELDVAAVDPHVPQHAIV